MHVKCSTEIKHNFVLILQKKHGHNWQFLFVIGLSLKIFSSESTSPIDLFN